MKATIKLDDELALETLVNELGIPFISLKYAELEIDFIFSAYDDVTNNLWELDIATITNIQLINQEDCIVHLDISKQDELAINDWVYNYKNLYNILYKLWNEHE